MDRYIAIPIVPVSGTPYEKLVNVDSIVIQDRDGVASGFLVVAQNMLGPQVWYFDAVYTSGGAAVDTDDVFGWTSRALSAFNSVSGPVQKALDSPYFDFKFFSYL
jgi:hypothetical protein